MARSSWRQAAEALPLIQEAKRAKHAKTGLAHGLELFKVLSMQTTFRLFCFFFFDTSYMLQ